MKKRSDARFFKSPTGSVIFGVLFSFLSLVLVTAIVGVVLSATENPTRSIGIASMISFLLSGAITGFVISKVKRERGRIYSVVTALIFILCILIISFIVGKGDAPLATLMNCVCYLLINLLFSFVVRKQSTRKRRRRFA